MAIVQSLLVLGLVIVTLAFALPAFIRIYAMVNVGSAEPLTHTWKERLASVMRYVFGQQKVLEDRPYGFMHFFYLYGFLILGIGHLELVLFGLTRFVEALGYTPFLYRNLPMMPTSLLHAYEFSQDCMAACVVAVVSIALYKRISGGVARLMPRSADAERILVLIGLLYVTFFVFIGSETLERMQSGELPHHWLWHLPVSSALALAFGDISHGTVAGANMVGFFMHLGVFLGFACYIPYSKHLHLVCAGPNIYCRHFDAVAKPRSIDFEKSEKFGVDRVHELSWKALLDTFACTECGRCDAVCPAHLTGKSLKPKKVLHDIKMNLRYENWAGQKEFRDALGRVAKGKDDVEKAYVPKTPLVAREPISQNDKEKVLPNGAYNIEGQVHLDDLWACTTCAACVEACPVLIDSVPTSLMEMRRNLVMMEADGYPKELNAAFRGLEQKANPWGVSQDRRMEWAESLDVPLLADQGEREVEYLFWVGCAGATDERAKKIQQALVRVLKAANVDFAVMGCEEKCTGDPARRMGHEYLYDQLAKENVQALNTYQAAKKFKKIFATCPHCFNQLKNEYKDFGGHYTVQHHTELLSELLKDKRIPLATKAALKETITFHDPCYLGRYNEVYQAPRQALATLPGVSVVEMTMNQKKSFCCGAGGGRMFMEEHIGKRINLERTDQAIKTGAATVATGCPFCMTMMSDGVKDRGADETMRVKDLAEVIAERLV